MSKMLVITEKANVATDLARALGGFRKAEHGWERDDAVIVSARGHCVSLQMPLAATSGKNLQQLPVVGEFVTELIEKNISIYRNIEKQLKRGDINTIVNACDAGREGELIFRLIVEHAGCKKPMKRMWIQSMTTDGFKEAFGSMRPGEDLDDLYYAGRSRSIADFIVGINGSRAITYMRDEQSNAGRVQTPTGMLLYDREMAIRNFKPTDYWEIHATFQAEAGQYLGKWFDPSKAKPKSEEESEDADDADKADKQDAASGMRIFDRAVAEAIIVKCRGKHPSSVTDVAKRTTRSAPSLYNQDSLQQDASRKYKFSAKKTLEIAQALYDDHKLTTYPRTDSEALTEDYGDTVLARMKNFDGTPYGVHGQRVLSHGWVNPSDKGIFNNAKVTDHFAIVPTEKSPVGVTLSDDERKIYDLIVRRFMAAFHPAAEFDVTTRISLVEGESFKSTGRVLVKEGWLAVYGQEIGDSKKEPPLVIVKPGEAVKTVDMKAVTCKTKPPSRYTDGTLIKAMVNAGKDIDDKAMREAMKGRGLGTVATRADTIEGLLSTGPKNKPRKPYAVREKDFIVPTDKLMSLMEFIRKEDIDLLASAETTGEWEYKLGLVQKGKLSSEEFLGGIKAEVARMLDKIRKQASSMPVANRTVLQVPCPKCGQPLAAGARTVECQAGCGFRLWREVSGRLLSETELNTLLKEGSIAKLDGFISKFKNKYSAGLKFEGDKIDLVYEDRGERANGADRPPVSILPVLNVPCPKCKGTIRIHGGDRPKFSCEKGDFTLWRIIAQRELSESEAITLIKQGSMPAVTGFISSKTGKPFAAGLRMSRDKSKVDFDYGK
jgi:DNA topoisomerase III